MTALQEYMKSALSEDEQACVYSALILVDDDIPVTEDKILTVLQAANIHVEPIWPSLFAKALKGINVRDLITNVGGISTATFQETSTEVTQLDDATNTAAGGKAGETAPAVEDEEDSDDDLGLSLFD